jgi:hypothetical protein
LETIAMTILVTFRPTKPMSASQYGEALRRLEKAGAAAPAGRIHHFCFGAPTSLQVIDIWDSQANFDKFGAVLMPILTAIGIDIGAPAIQPLHNAIAGR